MRSAWWTAGVPPANRRFAGVGRKPVPAMAAMRSGVSYRSRASVRPAPSETAVASSVSSATSRSVRPEVAAAKNSATTLRADAGPASPPPRRAAVTRRRARCRCCRLAASVTPSTPAISAWL